GEDHWQRLLHRAAKAIAQQLNADWGLGVVFAPDRPAVPGARDVIERVLGDEEARLRARRGELATALPRHEYPIEFDSQASSLLVYQLSQELARQRFDATILMSTSPFFSALDTNDVMLRSNFAMCERLKSTGGRARRFVVTQEGQAERTAQELVDLQKRG